jgi:hypothetical protein
MTKRSQYEEHNRQGRGKFNFEGEIHFWQRLVSAAHSSTIFQWHLRSFVLVPMITKNGDDSSISTEMEAVEAAVWN